MTTVAYDGRYIACDSQETAGSTITQCVKFEVVNEDFVAFSSGTASACLKAVDYLKRSLNSTCENGTISFPNDMFKEDESFAVWLVNLHNSVVCEFTKDGMTSKRLMCQDAMGSGRDIAITAMYLGKNAREAINVASALDCYTGGPVHVFDTVGGCFLVGGSGKGVPTWNDVTPKQKEV